MSWFLPKIDKYVPSYEMDYLEGSNGSFDIEVFEDEFEEIALKERNQYLQLETSDNRFIPEARN